LLDRGCREDGVALIRAEGEAAGNDGVLSGSARNLKRRAQVANGEGRAEAVGADDRGPAYRRMGQIERRSRSRQFGVLPKATDGWEARRIGAVDQQRDVGANVEDARMRERIRGQIVGNRQRLIVPKV